MAVWVVVAKPLAVLPAHARTLLAITAPPLELAAALAGDRLTAAGGAIVVVVLFWRDRHKIGGFTRCIIGIVAAT